MARQLAQGFAFAARLILMGVGGSKSDDTIETDLEPAFARIPGDQILCGIASHQISCPKRCCVACATTVSPTDVQGRAARMASSSSEYVAQVTGR